MSTPEEHPDDDLLADLSAGLLEGEAARVTEAHVVSCPECLELLEGSEAMAGPLRRLSGELTEAPMPYDVLARLERAVRVEVTGTPDVAEPLAAPATAPTTAPTRMLKPMSAAKASRMARPTSGARRQQRGEERDEDRTFLLMRYGRWAAAAVLVVGVGVGAVAGFRSLTGGGDGAGEAATSADSASVATPVLATGTNYVKDSLRKQVDTLVADSRSGKSAAAYDASGAAQPGAEKPESASSSATGSDSSGALTRGGVTGLADPAVLDRCLTAIGRGGQRPVAVDLARYQDQEAAVIVLQEADGTYEVQVVARTCAPGAEGTIAVETVQP